MKFIKLHRSLTRRSDQMICTLSYVGMIAAQFFCRAKAALRVLFYRSVGFLHRISLFLAQIGG